MSTLDMILKLGLTLGATAVVVVVAFFILKAIQRFQLKMTAPGDSPALNFERSIPLGPKERITVVQYGSERLILGVTQGGISLLKTVDIEADVPEEPSAE